MNYSIRKLRESEQGILEEFLYEAIYIPEGIEAPPKNIIEQPELQVYIDGFGSKKDDLCFVAETDKGIIGAVWVRDMNDYGHIEAGVPSLAVSIIKEYRGHGIGTEMMKRILYELKKLGYKKVSLSVQKMNYAVKMYKKIGFKIIGENEEEFIMVYDFKQEKDLLRE